MDTGTMMEYRVVCALFGDDGHQFHRYPKYSLESAERTVLERNHKAELDADKPVKERYMDHVCAPYRAQQSPVSEWENIG